MVYDFTFVLPGFTPIPAGGTMVVFELSRYLVDNGYTVLIIFLKRIHRNLYNIVKDQKLLDRNRNRSLEIKIYDYIQNTISTRILISIMAKHPSYLKIIGVQLGQNSDSHTSGTFFSEFSFGGIDFSVKNDIPKRLRTQRIVATAWQTSYFVNRFQGSNFKYYLVQNDEDNPAFSGSLNVLARKSYDLPLKKIVINRQMQERFSLESPIKINVAAHVIGKILRQPEARDNKVILMQLREGEDKGAVYAIEAALLIKTKRPDIEIISFGNYKHDLPVFIKHLGYVSNADYIELFNIATIFVLPSLIEGFPIPVIEAMSCGCVPVATKCKGPENFIEHNMNGILVPIMEPKAIADSAIWLLENRNIRIKMAYNAIETSLNYSIDRMGNEFTNGILKYEGKAVTPRTS